MIKYLSLIAVVSLCCSCKKPKDTAPDPVTPLSTREMDVTVTTRQNSINVALKGDATYSLLGYGYDITGKYADTASARAKAVDVRLFVEQNNDRFEFDRSVSAGPKVIIAENAEDYALQLSSSLQETTGTKSFKGSITSAFATQDALTDKYIYASYTYFIQQKRLKLNVSAGMLRPFLTPEFNHDVLTLSTAGLVQKYGTHILTDVVLGARMTALFQAETNAANRLNVAKTGFSYAIAKVFSLFSGSLDALNNTDLQQINTPKIYYDAIGGDISKIQSTQTPKQVNVNIGEWTKSVSNDKAAFIGLSSHGFIPLYELITEPIKKEQIKLFVTNYLANSEVKLTNTGK